MWRAEPLPSFVMAFRENELVGTKLPRQMDLHDAITLALLIRSDPNQLPSYTFGTLVPVAFQCSAEDAVILCDGFFRERRSYCQFTRETRTAQVGLHSV